MTDDQKTGAKRSVEEEVATSLGRMVEGEARRLLSESILEGDPQRLADGWQRRFIADGRRAQEMIELYESLGYEVVAEPVRPDEIGEDCDDCQLAALLKFVTIYTRKKEG